MSRHAQSTWSLSRLTVHQNTPVRMRDGVELATDIYIPNGSGPFPALILRTPYDKADATETSYAHAAWYAQHGFVVLCQDVRGRWASGGDFLPFLHEASDGSDTVSWAASQPWCTGKVGMYGFSYPGATQMLAAAAAPANLVAIAPVMTGSTLCEGWTFRGGIFELAFILSWAASLARDDAVRAGDNESASELGRFVDDPRTLYSVLPIRTALPSVLLRYAPYLRDWMAHPEYDDYWRQFSPREGYQKIRASGLHVAGWHDSFLTGTVENFAGVSQAGQAPQRLIVGPWYHMPWSQHVGEIDFGWDGRNIVDELQLQFFSQTLKGDRGADSDTAPVQLFVMGSNRWHHASSWPPSSSETRTMFLASDGRANSLSGTGSLSPDGPSGESPVDMMPCNPLIPVNSVGGRSCCVADTAPMGPADQRCQEIRNDVLVYTSEILDEDLLVIGRPQLTIYLATDSRSVDVVAKLTDVHSDGRSIAVSDGVRRLRPGEADQGKRVELSIEMSPTAICFKAGHRIRLTLAGSDFPARDRNPHNGENALDASWSDFRIATEVVFHDASCPSRVVLPLV